MNTLTASPTLQARIRWNRLRVVGALIQVEDDVTAASRQFRIAQSMWRYSGPVLFASGVAWSLRGATAGQRGGRLLGLLFSARSVLTMAQRFRILLRGSQQ